MKPPLVPLAVYMQRRNSDPASINGWVEHLVECTMLAVLACLDLAVQVCGIGNQVFWYLIRTVGSTELHGFDAEICARVDSVFYTSREGNGRADEDGCLEGRWLIWRVDLMV